MTGAAARQDDPVEHSSALSGLLAGLALGAGAVLVGIAVVGTGGLGGLAIAAMIGAGAATGAGIGQLLGSLSHAQRETGWITSGSDNVHINGRPAARAHVDKALCTDHPGVPQTLAQGSRTVYINGQPAARVGDSTVCDGRISAGSSNVFIGGDTETTDEIVPEVPGWLEAAVFGVGVASAVALVGPAMTLWGTFGGVVGGTVAGGYGVKLYGQDSDQQKLLAFGGAVIAGSLASRYRFGENGGLAANFGNLKITRRSAKGYVGMLRGELYRLPDVKTERFLYIKRPTDQLKTLRREFDSRARSQFLKELSSDAEKVTLLKKAGFNDAEISRIQSGRVPSKEWEVHHVWPLDDGGTNDFSNLTLIKSEPFHKVLTNQQKALTKGMLAGDKRWMEWPVIDSKIYPGPGE
ncbi:MULTISPECIES: PAAR domain-containing protein [unclassified Pseudomonas]|uniref:PAAR domain-containing protein n=2 Tax=Pseudomonas TaxID=286 RepID=UPI000A1F4147|nr:MULTISPECIES: PAAR domain-containing protein [unclassified Pseudomonas]